MVCEAPLVKFYFLPVVQVRIMISHKLPDATATHGAIPVRATLAPAVATEAIEHPHARPRTI